jgi:hypothetical protein
MPEIEIEDGVSHDKNSAQGDSWKKMWRKSFYTASGTSKSMLLTGNVSRIHALQVVCYLLSFKATNDHAHKILHYWLLR